MSIAVQEKADSEAVGENKTEEADDGSKNSAYTEQQSIDAECEKLLWNTKKQVKQMMEEAVTKKFIHEESSSILALCVAVDACLTHGLKRRALGLFKTNSSTALIQKVAKSCKSAEEVLELVDKAQIAQRQQLDRKQSDNQASNSSQRQRQENQPKSPASRQSSCNSGAQRRNSWIKYALIEKKLVAIVDYLTQNSSKYYEPDALLANCLCAQILSSLLVGPSALEFSRSKASDCYQFEDPSADELLKRHKLANPIACLCTSTNQQPTTLSRRRASNQLNALDKNGNCEPELPRSSRSPSPCRPGSFKQDTRRRPLGLKNSVKSGTLVTDCHHYSCQEISEHEQTKGYSFLCSSDCSNGLKSTTSSTSGLNAATCSGPNGKRGLTVAVSSHNGQGSQQQGQNSYDWQPWSPMMLHETLHQNSKSSLLYAKNNVLLETQPGQTMAGYLSLHQTNSDLVLKWIPNQMINGSQLISTISDTHSDNSDMHDENNSNPARQQQAAADHVEPIAVESSYLDMVVSLSVSRIVLLHCQFVRFQPDQDLGFVAQEEPIKEDQPAKEDDEQQVEVLDMNTTAARIPATEETLILVEADGVQRAPFKFPKGGLRLFLSCLESGLMPDKFLDPAIKFDENWPDPLRLFSLGDSSLDSPSASNSETSSLGKLDVLLKRLPSLKRKPPAVRQDSPTGECKLDMRTESPQDSQQAGILPTYNYVYRIVSVNQPDWPLTTPPHSAYSLESSSSSSFGHMNPVMPMASSNRLPVNGQKFRWSLGRLARFSSRYTQNSAGSTSSSNGYQNQSTSSMGLSSPTLANGNGLDAESSSAGGDQLTDGTTVAKCGQPSGNHFCPESKAFDQEARDLVRIEAKLSVLKESTSDHVLALRTQSVQTLCESMRKQILARAFYGWLVHCRKVKIIREHLMKLVHPRDRCLLLDDVDGQKCFHNFEEFQVGLTWTSWRELMQQRDQRAENDLCQQVNLLVYHGGIEDNELRKEVWPYLLRHYSYKDSPETKRRKDESARKAYECCWDDWIKIERVVKQRDNELLAANMAKASNRMQQQQQQQSVIEGADQADAITKPVNKSDTNNNSNNNNNADDCNTNSSTNHEFDSLEEQADNLTDGKSQDLAGSNKTAAQQRQIASRKAKDVKLAAKRRRRRRARLESTGSVGSDASITDQFGNNIHRIDKDVQRCDRNFWYFKESKNLDKLRNIMCCYVWQHLDVGYVQGMCDLAAPFLVIFDNEILAYSCFSQLMKRMVYNFPHGNAMDQHFESLKYLMQVLDPKLFEILQSNGDYTHFYFCYRWLLLDFKREFVYEDVYKVWETIWSARQVASDYFVVFLALAMVKYYRDIIIENNMDFTDTIKFFNEMAERHDARRITALARDCIIELLSLIKTG